MTCRDCRDLMLEVARCRAAPDVERTVRAHTASCPECRGRFEQERALTAGLRAVAQIADDGPAASRELEVWLKTAFAAQHDRRQARRPSAGAVKQWLPLAAALLLCAGATTWWLKAPVRVAHQTSQVARVAPPPLPAVAPPPAVAVLNPIERPGPRVTRRPRPARPASARAVQAVGFVPIPSAAGLPDFESGEIVRLGIPVTALPNYGLEIPSGAQSAIQADLLIGQDGQARAIRLVNVRVNANVESPRPRQ